MPIVRLIEIELVEIPRDAAKRAEHRDSVEEVGLKYSVGGGQGKETLLKERD